MAQTTYNIMCCTYDFLQKPFNDLFVFVFVLYFSLFSKLLLNVEKWSATQHNTKNENEYNVKDDDDDSEIDNDVIITN